MEGREGEEIAVDVTQGITVLIKAVRVLIAKGLLSNVSQLLKWKWNAHTRNCEINLVQFLCNHFMPTRKTNDNSYTVSFVYKLRTDTNPIICS